MDKLQSLQYFTAVAEQGSFAAAAKQLGTNPSTVSKAIGRLEKSLKVQLFQRTTRKLGITDAGESYLRQVQKMVQDLSACEESLQQANESPEGRLRINLPVSYGRCYVTPALAMFHKQYPHIELDISYDDNYIDIIEQGFDVSIRSGTLSDSRVVAYPLSCMDFVTCAAPAFKKQYKNKPLNAASAEQFPWIRFRFKQSGKLMPILLKEHDEIDAIEPGNQFIVDDGEAMIDLCEQGLGLTQVPQFIARSALNAKRVEPFYPTISTPDSGVYIVYAKREFLPARVRVFVEHMKAYVRNLGESSQHTWAQDLVV